MLDFMHVYHGLINSLCQFWYEAALKYSAVFGFSFLNFKNLMQICLTITLEAGLSTNILTMLHYQFFIACYKNKLVR